MKPGPVPVRPIFSTINTLAGPILTLVYPLIASIKAVESPFKEDDQQWLTYWVIYSLLTLMEMVLQSVLRWVPFYHFFKLAFVAWLVLPQTRGAALIYERLVLSHLTQLESKKVDGPSGPASLTTSQRRMLQSMRPETRHAVAKYISENGQAAFHTLLTVANKEASKRQQVGTVEE
eukprot:SM000170S02668  [mRNA]  locus=s170:51689:53237:- [translate_table: standard]